MLWYALAGKRFLVGLAGVAAVAILVGGGCLVLQIDPEPPPLPPVRTVALIDASASTDRQEADEVVAAVLGLVLDGALDNGGSLAVYAVGERNRVDPRMVVEVSTDPSNRDRGIVAKERTKAKDALSPALEAFYDRVLAERRDAEDEEEDRRSGESTDLFGALTVAVEAIEEPVEGGVQIFSVGDNIPTATDRGCHIEAEAVTRLDEDALEAKVARCAEVSLPDMSGIVVELVGAGIDRSRKLTEAARGDARRLVVAVVEGAGGSVAP